MAILEVQDIHTYYGDAYVLQGLAIALEEGQILGLLGRNGGGKSTAMRIVAGVLGRDGGADCAFVAARVAGYRAPWLGA